MTKSSTDKSRADSARAGATDSYTRFVNSSLGKKIASGLGLPRPVQLRRLPVDHPSAPVTGRVAVLGPSAFADTVASQLLAWGWDVQRDTYGELDAIVGVYLEPDFLGFGSLALQIGGGLKTLKPHGRVLMVGYSPDVDAGAAGSGAGLPASTAALQSRATSNEIIGFTRSLGKEMRRGATANAVLLTSSVTGAGSAGLGPTLQSALQFFLTPRSAFVNGQVLQLDPVSGRMPEDWARPLAGKIAVVTGAGQGIGAEITRVLARDGAQVIGVDLPSNGQALAEVANACGAVAMQLDVTDPEAGEKLAKLIAARYGKVNILVHNAGITRDKLLANMDESRWNSVLAVSAKATLALTEALQRYALISDDGRVIGLSSTTAIAGNRGQTNYASAKGAIIGLTQAWAQDAGANFTANAIAPGFIETEMTSKIPFATREVARRLNSLQQGGRPQDVAEAISFIASPASSGINGQVLRVCGQNLVGA